MDATDLQAATTVVVSALRETPDAEWDRPTPCPDWTVRQLVQHLVVGTDRFMMRFGHEGTTAVPAPDASGVELLDALEASTAELVQVFEGPGAMQQVIELPIGAMPGQAALDLRVTETITHGWDLGRALGRPLRFDPDLVERAVGFSQEALTRIPEGRSPFGTPQAAPEGANAHDRLAALLGRQPVVS